MRDARRRPFGGPRRQRVEAHRVAIDVVAVDELLGDQHVHQAVGECCVGAGHQRDVLVTLLGRRAAIRVDGDQPRTAALGFLRARPEVQVRRDRVAAPDQDQPAVLVLLDVHPDRRADHGAPASLAGGSADRAVEQRRAETVEEAPVHRAVLQIAHRARVAVGHDGLRTVGRGRDAGEARRNLVERLVPRDAGEAAFAFAAHAAHRMQHAVGRIGAVEIARDLGAQRAVRVGCAGSPRISIALPCFDCHEHRARIGTIVRARGAHDAARGGRDVSSSGIVRL